MRLRDVRFRSTPRGPRLSGKPGSVNMVDRRGRDQLARHIRHLAAGRITNDEFMERAFHADGDWGRDPLPGASLVIMTSID